MDKVRRVAVAEYLNAVRSKAFIISVLLVPLIIVLAVGLQMLGHKKADASDRKFAVVDETGKLFAVLEKAAERRNENLNQTPEKLEKFEKIIPKQPKYVPLQHDRKDRDRTTLELELSSQVRKEELFAFLLIEAEVYSLEPGTNGRVTYYTQTPTFEQLPRWIESTINNEVRRSRLAQAGMDGAKIAQLSRRANFDRRGLASKDSSGKFQKAKKTNQVKNILVPLGALMLMFMSIMMSAPMLLNTVLEEKMNKVAEVLISSVSPFHLMIGKLIGCVFVSLTLALIYLGSLALGLHRMGYLDMVPWDLVAWFIPFQIMALAIYGSLFLSIGAACNELRDSQNLMAPAMVMAMVPMFVWMPIVQSPNSSFSQVMSLIPPFTPMLMTLRLASTPGPAIWELALAVVLTTGFMLFCVWAAAKIFRIGILAQGQSPSLVKLVSWLWSK